VAGGSNSYVVRVTCADGSPAVLKVVLDDEGLAAQIRTLDVADGRGYARLLRSDPVRGAMLMEALGQPLQASGRPAEEQL
uniref:aminoglycoside phosphotransferase family protein n=1 Tax=Salmonella sp. SAL4434 TaxID=3159889 RepID=UPI00397DC07D